MKRYPRTMHFRWCVQAPWRALHRVVGGRVTREHFVGVIQGATLCGKRGNFYMPGILERIGLPRCAQCCRAARIPWGYGAPFNSKLASRRFRDA